MIATRPRILTICHNHPSLHPGGSEIFGYELFKAMKATGAVDALFVACANQIHRERRPGTAFQTLGRSGDEIILWSGHFDRFFLSQIDLHGVVPELSRLLRDFRPDIVHLHHTLLLGVEMLHVIRRVLPGCRVVMTLHDYYAICPNDGQMVTATTRELCHGASPDACHRCFPDRGREQFLLREKHIKTLFGMVDHFIAPSRFLHDRFVAWGLPPGRISVLRNGRPAVEPAPRRKARQGTVFGYFGNLNPYKGALVLIEAARRLAEAGERDFSVVIHGGMPFQSDAFRGRFEEALAGTAGVVAHRGPYGAAELPALMGEVDWVVVPSIWWENAPLVILEACQHRRPVICSDIGGMAELVPEKAGGLHFRVGDAAHLARVMRDAMAAPSLWQRKSAALPQVPTMTRVAAEHLALIDGLLKGAERAAV